MNRGFYEIVLHTVEKEPVNVRNVRVRIFDSNRPDFSLVDERHLRFPPSNTYEVPAYPQTKFVVAEITAPRFRQRKSKAEKIIHDHRRNEPLTLIRDPLEWKAEFVRWNDLPQPFHKLVDVLERSSNIIIDSTGYLLLTGNAYDGINEPAEILAKTCLLNLHSKMTEMIEPVYNEKPWFYFVREILSVGRERMIAIVNPAMAPIVKTINKNDSQFEKYKDSPAGGHRSNIPNGYTILDIYSIKSHEDYGNIQLTIAETKAPDGTDVTILDADIDENGKLLPHIFDLAEHQFTDGTHPFDIHEFLVHKYPDEPLGYRLI